MDLGFDNSLFGKSAIVQSKSRRRLFRESVKGVYGPGCAPLTEVELAFRLDCQCVSK